MRIQKKLKQIVYYYRYYSILIFKSLVKLAENSGKFDSFFILNVLFHQKIPVLIGIYQKQFLNVTWYNIHNGGYYEF